MPCARGGRPRRGGGGQLDGLVDKPDAKPPTAKNGVLFRLFSRLRLRETPKNGASVLPNADECKAKLQTDRRRDKKPKKNLKTHNN
jgi:hypothetical protein